MGTMAPIRPTVQGQHPISLTAGRPLGGLLGVLEVLEVVGRPGGVRLAAGVPGGGVAGEGKAEDAQCSRCADSSPRLLERRPAAVPGGSFVDFPGARPRRPSCHHRGQRALPPCLRLPRAWVPAVAASLTSAPGSVRWPHSACRVTTNRPASALAAAKTAHPARREGINMHGFIKRAAVAPGYGPVASDVR